MRDTFNIEDIEIVKGASGSEYGRRRPGALAPANLYDPGVSDAITGQDIRYAGQINEGHTKTLALHAFMGWELSANLSLQLNVYNLANQRYIASLNSARRAPHPGRGALGQAGRHAEVPRQGCCWAATAIHSLIRLFLYFY
ncbi:hypothetical protein [Delftia sp. PE138]|uniref:hypothetical protein n=1 Tax=Delftia sp. PE138 TaxID=1812483 RepID=UPI001BAE608C|nr:hypothetical protein [Delftia sp. PE138]MBS3720075.1 hypothetical protein [Delftia sp. PE138]